MKPEENVIVDTNELIKQRRSKLAALRQKAIAYPNDFKRNALANTLHDTYAEKTESELESESEPLVFKLAGRMMTRRLMGKASFVHLQDMTGRFQLYVRQDAISPEAYADFLQWDLGDIIGAEGHLFKTKTGELSLRVQHIRLLTKSLRPLPDKYHGLTDQETCYRQRYLDLLMNEHTHKTFLIRTKIIEYIRQFLRDRDFIEAETPMMQVLPGGGRLQDRL